MPVAAVVQPQEEPVSLARAKAHLRVDHDADDDLIMECITAAREHVEGITQRSLARRTWEWTAGRFPHGRVDLPFPPLVSVESVTYVDTAGVSRTMDPASYLVDVDRGDALRLAAGTYAWPDVRDGGPVRVRYIAGYEPVSIPRALVAAILLVLGHLYFNRESVITGTIATELPLGVDALTARWRAGRMAH